MRNLAPFLVRAGLAIAMLVPTGAHAEPRLEAVDALVKPLIGSQTPGLGVLVSRRGTVLHMQGYGLADIKAKTPVTETTLFDLASVSKQITAQAAMLQMEDGLYAPETPIEDLLPEFVDLPGGYRKITIADLVHHVAGLPDYLNSDDLDYTAETTNEEVVAWLGHQEPDRAPGTAYEYSNSAYLSLGSLIAAADHAADLATVLKARIFGPLGMKRTGVLGTEAVDLADAVTGYKSGSKGGYIRSFDPTVTQGDGNVFTNLVDLSRYENAFYSHALLSEEAVDRLFANGTLDDGSAIEVDGEGYGYGWSIATVEGDRYVSHGGSWNGTATYYQRNLTTGLTVIVLSNNEDMDSEALAGEIETAVEAE